MFVGCIFSPELRIHGLSTHMLIMMYQCPDLIVEDVNKTMGLVRTDLGLFKYNNNIYDCIVR